MNAHSCGRDIFEEYRLIAIAYHKNRGDKERLILGDV